MKLLNLHAGKFPTRVLKTQASGDLVLAETFYTAGQAIAEHSHKYSGFIIVLTGEFLEQQEGQSRVCKSSDVIFRPAGQLHSDHFENTSAKCLNIQYGPEWLNRLQRITGDSPASDPYYFSGGVLFQLGLKVFREFHIADMDSPLIVEGIVLEMIGEANRMRRSRTESGIPLWLRKVRDQLHAGLSNELRIQELARDAGVHPVYLNRVFRKHYGKSIGEYLRSLRMQFCISQLAATNLPIAHISTAAGFYDQGHFSRVFKRSCGMTPLAYRRLFRKV